MPLALRTSSYAQVITLITSLRYTNIKKKKHRFFEPKKHFSTGTGTLTWTITSTGTGMKTGLGFIFLGSKNRGFCFQGLGTTLVDVESGMGWRKSELLKTNHNTLHKGSKERQDRRKGFYGFCLIQTQGDYWGAENNHVLPPKGRSVALQSKILK